MAAVGGTSLRLAADGSYLSEGTWATARWLHQSFDRPDRLRHRGRDQPQLPRAGLAKSGAHPVIGGHRGIADISWNADPNPGSALYLTFQGYCAGLCGGGVGGTSVAAPQWAGLAALIDQAAGRRVGQLAPLLYASAVRDRQGTCVGDPYHDITTGSNFGYDAGPGWDFPTGSGVARCLQSGAGDSGGARFDPDFNHHGHRYANQRGHRNTNGNRDELAHQLAGRTGSPTVTPTPTGVGSPGPKVQLPLIVANEGMTNNGW